MAYLPQGRGRVGLVSEMAGIGTIANSQLSAAPADSLMATRFSIWRFRSVSERNPLNGPPFSLRGSVCNPAQFRTTIHVNSSPSEAANRCQI